MAIESSHIFPFDFSPVVEAKVGAVEALQPKVDRRMAELSGSVRGPKSFRGGKHGGKPGGKVGWKPWKLYENSRETME